MCEQGCHGFPSNISLDLNDALPTNVSYFTYRCSPVAHLPALSPWAGVTLHDTLHGRPMHPLCCAQWALMVRVTARVQGQLHIAAMHRGPHVVRVQQPAAGEGPTLSLPSLRTMNSLACLSVIGLLHCCTAAVWLQCTPYSEEELKRGHTAVHAPSR